MQYIGKYKLLQNVTISMLIPQPIKQTCPLNHSCFLFLSIKFWSGCWVSSPATAWPPTKFPTHCRLSSCTRKCLPWSRNYQSFIFEVTYYIIALLFKKNHLLTTYYRSFVFKKTPLTWPCRPPHSYVSWWGNGTALSRTLCPLSHCRH